MFYFTWSVGSHKNQKKLISELNKNTLIISGGPSYSWDIPINIKLPILSDYINKNYDLLYKVNDYKILQKKL